MSRISRASSSSASRRKERSVDKASRGVARSLRTNMQGCFNPTLGTSPKSAPSISTAALQRLSRLQASAAAAPPKEWPKTPRRVTSRRPRRSEEHTSELQSHSDLVCRLLLEKKKVELEP